MDMKALVPLLAQVALSLIVASVAMRAQWRDVVGAIRRSGLLLRAIVAVYVVVPLVAVLTSGLFPIEPPIRIGIVIMALSPLAPLATGKMLRAGMDAATVVGLYVALIVAAVIIVPASVALLSALFPPDASISPLAIAKVVTIGVLVPVAAGLLIAAAAPHFSSKAAGPVGVVGNVTLLLLAALILYAQGSKILSLIGDGAVVVMAAAALSGIVAGHLLGGPKATNRAALAQAAATRHPGIAALIASTNFADRRVVLAAILFLLTSVIVTIGYQLWLKRRGDADLAAASTDREARTRAAALN